EKYADVGRNAPTKCELLVRAIQDQIVTIDEL
ncbi:LuxR family transcriptional regulator, partial [Rhodococcus erythropolis]